MADIPPRLLPPKKEVALALLEGESVFIHLDPRREGVAVPKSFAKQPQLVLQIGLNLAIRIPDLTIDDDGVSCTLSFNRSPFWCRMPWGSIYALVGPDGRGMLWPEDVPPEVAEQMRGGRAPSRDARPGDATPREALKAAKGPAGKRPRGRPAAASGEDGERDPRSERGEETSASRRPGARPVLAAVPTPRPPEPRSPAPLPFDRGSGAGALPQTAPLGAHDRSRAGRAGGAPASTGQTTGGKKAKRELPPYLRVVK